MKTTASRLPGLPCATWLPPYARPYARRRELPATGGRMLPSPRIDYSLGGGIGYWREASTEGASAGCNPRAFALIPPAKGEAVPIN